MKKRYALTGLLLGFMLICQAQSGQTSGKSQLISLDLHLPLGAFERSHVAGAGLNYSWSHRRFGRDIRVKKLIAFMANAGADYFIGKTVKTAGNNFSYGGYLFAHLMPGIIVNPWPKVHISLMAGPTLGIYKGNAEAGLGASINGSYFFSEKIAIGPTLNYRKQPDTDALWSIGARGSFLF